MLNIRQLIILYKVIDFKDLNKLDFYIQNVFCGVVFWIIWNIK
jgi:hypothetical protein